MKDYNEVVQDVLKRSAEKIENNKKRQRIILRTGCTVAAFGLVAVVGIRVWYGRSLRQEGNSAKQYTTLNDAQMSGGRDAIVSDVEGSKEHSEGEISGMDSGGMGGDNTMDGDPSGYSVGDDKAPSEGIRLPGGNPNGYDMTTEGEMDGESLQNSEICRPAPMGDGNEPEEAVEMISSYPEDVTYCYMAPGNGEFFCSNPLIHAMEEYGDGKLYKVVVDLFCGEELVRPFSEEAKLEFERLSELGYTVLWQSLGEGENIRYYYMLCAEGKRLKEFDAGEDYGYMFRFIDEQ